MAIFDRSIENTEDTPDYSFLLFSRPIEKGEEMLAAAVQP